MQPGPSLASCAHVAVAQLRPVDPLLPSAKLLSVLRAIRPASAVEGEKVTDMRRRDPALCDAKLARTVDSFAAAVWEYRRASVS